MPSPFQSPAPKVRLVQAFDAPYDNAIATALTCTREDVVHAEDVRRDAAARAQRDRIARSTYVAGHHTIFQHAHFQFLIQDVSRQLVWSFLHAHPFYNSEQVSQRFVPVAPQRVLVPTLPARPLAWYREAVERQMASYRTLAETLLGPAGRAYDELFPARRKQADVRDRAVRKRAQEIARYILPIATHTQLYHTVSGLTLHRYHRLSNSLDVPAEPRLLVVAMIDAVRAHDPLFFSVLEDPVPLEATPEWRALVALRGSGTPRDDGRFREAFDRDLGDRRSKLVDYKVNTEQTTARAVREVLGLRVDELSDADALALVLSPGKNPLLTGALTLTAMSKLGRTLVHPHYTFQKKLSHCADSQDQRHRMTPASRPALAAQFVGGAPDAVTPGLIATCPEAVDRYQETLAETWQAIDQLLDSGVSAEQALYLLPNAFPVRFTESGDLAALHHKWTTRLCYNAQEEIWHTTLDEVQQVHALHPGIGAHLLPPCGLRHGAGVHPACPEGPRFCGVKVWTLDRGAYARVL